MWAQEMEERLDGCLVWVYLYEGVWDGMVHGKVPV